jgi:hypothetical protein
MKKLVSSVLLGAVLAAGCSPVIPSPTTQPSVLQQDFDRAEQVLVAAEVAVADAQAALQNVPAGPTRNQLVQALQNAQEYEAFVQIAFNLAAAALGVNPTPPAVPTPATTAPTVAKAHADAGVAALKVAIAKTNDPKLKATYSKALVSAQKYQAAVK